VVLTKTSFGLEIGPSAARVAKLRLERGGRPLVVALDRFDFSSSPRPGEALESPRHRALALFAVAHAVGARDGVVAALSGVGTDDRVVSVAPVSDDRAASLARTEALRSGGFASEGCDFAACHLPSISVNEKRVIVLAHPASAVRELAGSLREVGAAPDAILPTPLALANFLRYDGHSLDDAFVVRIAERETDFLLFAGDAPWFRTIPYGSGALAAAMRAERGTGERESEAARIGLARGETAGVAAKVVEGFLDRIVAEAHAALAGEAARLPGAVEAFSRAFAARVDTAERLNRVRISAQAHASPELRDLPLFAPAIGAALQAIEEVSLPASFVAPDRERDAARRVPSLAAATILLLAVAAAGHRSSEAAAALGKELLTRTATIEARTDQLARERRLQEEAEGIRGSLERLLSLVPRRDDWERIPPAALDALSRAGALLETDFREAPGGLALEFALRPDDGGDAERAFQGVAAPLLREAGATELSLEPPQVAAAGAQPVLRGRAVFGRSR
jgi:hypothetical protein